MQHAAGRINHFSRRKQNLLYLPPVPSGCEVPTQVPGWGAHLTRRLGDVRPWPCPGHLLPAVHQALSRTGHLLPPCPSVTGVAGTQGGLWLKCRARWGHLT